MFRWETINNFGSLRERDNFLIWLQAQISSGAAEPVDPPPSFDGERWFRHLASGSMWRLVPEDSPYGPGFWPAYEEIAAA
jgi:hypothetical protein